MLGVRLFPPQVLSDLNFFNVNSEKKLASRLRAVQRVAAAAIGAYLMVRYNPILIAKLGSSYTAKKVVQFAFLVGYACLSFPATVLILTGDVGYRGTMYAVSRIRNEEIKWTVIDVALVGFSYYISQIYKDAKEGPNLLERLFQRVENKLTKPLYRRLYTQTT